MSEKNKKKDRKCDKCKKSFVMTAKEVKQHFSSCKGK